MLKYTECDTNENTIVSVFNIKKIEYECLIFGNSDQIQCTLGLSTCEISDLLWYGTITNGDLTYTTFPWRYKDRIINYKGKSFNIETIDISNNKHEIMIGLYDNNNWIENIEITKLTEKIKQGTLTVVMHIENDFDNLIEESNFCSKGNSLCEIVESHALGQKFFYCRTHRLEVLP